MGWWVSLHEESHGENKGQWVQAPGTTRRVFYLHIRNKFLTLGTTIPYNNLPRGVTEPLSLEFFQMWLDRMAGHLNNPSQAPPPVVGWTRWSPKVPSNHLSLLPF